MAADDDDAQARADELCALNAIYGEGFVRVLDAAPSAAPSSIAVTLPEPGAQPHLELRAGLPDSYPSQHPPVFELACDLLPPDALSRLAAEMEGLFAPGEVVLWQWIEHLRERWADLAPQPAAAAPDGGSADAALAAELQAAELLGADVGEEGGGRGARQQRQREAEDPEYEAALAEVASTVVHGEPCTERRSTFQAHVAPATSTKHVEALMELLLQNNKIRAATHNIMAYRIEQAGKEGVFLQDHDEDGEQAAGGRLLHLLQVADARNVVVVVSRWYGGVLLGPSRFGIINNTARELLEAQGFITPGGGGGGGKGGGKGKKR